MLNFLFAFGAIVLTGITIILAVVVICACRIMWTECSRLIAEKKQDKTDDK